MMSSVVKILPHYSYEDYRLWELIEGMPYAMSPAPVPLHRKITNNLTIKKKYLDFSPDLVAEVLSPSTALKDRHTKFDLYESQKIKYYLMMTPETKEVEIIPMGEWYLSFKT